MPSVSSIRSAMYACPSGHEFRALSKSQLDRASGQPALFYRTADNAPWLPVPKCPDPACPLVGQPILDIRSGSSFARVPENERAEVWLSPDGQRVSVPGRRGAPMPERYRRAGYITVQADTMRDIDRLERIRSAQTGNTAYHETNFSAARRAERAEMDYSDDLTSDT